MGHYKVALFSISCPHMWSLNVQNWSSAFSPNYLGSRWPRKWADILFMRRKIHFAEASSTPGRRLCRSLCSIIVPHLSFISFGYSKVVGRVCNCWVWWMFPSGECCGASHRGGATWLKVIRYTQQINQRVFLQGRSEPLLLLLTSDWKKSTFCNEAFISSNWPTRMKRLFSRETTMAHYYEGICRVRTEDNYLQTAVMMSYYILWTNRPHPSWHQLSTWPASQV